MAAWVAGCIGDADDATRFVGSGRRRTLSLLPWPLDGLRSPVIADGEEDSSSLSLLLPAGDRGDVLRSRQIWNRSLASVLVDGSDQPIGASPMVVLDGSDAVIDEGDKGDLVQRVIAVLLIGSDQLVGRLPRSS
ncbi:hypothetical protein ACLOJK_038659 [Asimina triloba]